MARQQRRQLNSCRPAAQTDSAAGPLTAEVQGERGKLLQLARLLVVMHASQQHSYWRVDVVRAGNTVCGSLLACLPLCACHACIRIRSTPTPHAVKCRTARHLIHYIQACHQGNYRGPDCKLRQCCASFALRTLCENDVCNAATHWQFVMFVQARMQQDPAAAELCRANSDGSSTPTGQLPRQTLQQPPKQQRGGQLKVHCYYGLPFADVPCIIACCQLAHNALTACEVLC